MDQSLQSLLERMNELENKNRRLARQSIHLKRLVGVCVVGVALAVSLGATNANHSVVLEDPGTGKRIIDMVTTPSGAAGFQVWDRNGRRRILLGTNDAFQPGLTMWDEQGRQRILIGINNESQAHVTLWDANGVVKAR